MSRISEINEALKKLDKTSVKEGEGHSLLMRRIKNLGEVSYEKEPVIEQQIKEITPIERLGALKKIENIIPQTVTHPFYIGKQDILDIVSEIRTVFKSNSEDEETFILFYEENTREILGEISTLISKRILEDINYYRNILELSKINYSKHMTEELRESLKYIFSKDDWRTISSMGVNLTIESLADKIFYEQILGDMDLLEQSKKLKIFIAFHSIIKTQKNEITFMKYKYNFNMEKED